MEPQPPTSTTLRLLPWLSPEGKPCFLSASGRDGYMSRLADTTETRQLTEGADVLTRARRLLADPVSPNAEVRYTAIRLTECLADALRVAESRGMRLPEPDRDTDPPSAR
ncbi:hypothetical protein F9278_25620 [Streptomyces phaeolivaceus]|uniref:Uncharacterized protein n=1 Tax=Streptomyces phaeolivaceus TaxID=2653200 RepID=A0A5P8K779_9ACTN|nr:hypothetical protein [Streptomyces phaeolivaceus]QFQ98971.1 hypothetical protein F9278_25620 [Streptomyces phaeolivaceus]